MKVKTYTIIVERADGMRKIAETIRTLENEVVQSNAILEAIEDILNGESTSDFMLSFPVVRRVEYLMVIKNSYEGLRPQKQK